MNSLTALIRAFDAATVSGERCALATIVGVDGSSYRRPGARMLVAERGACTGSISPGCLERDVIAHAHDVMQSGVPALLEYETATTADELSWGLGIGCGGTIRVLVESLDPESPYVAALRLATDERVNAHGLRLTTTYDEGSVTHEAELLSADDAATHPACEMMPGALVETLLPAVPLVVFGAGPDAVPLVELAARLGWRVEIVDPQARGSSMDRFPMAARVTLARPADVRDHVTITRRTMAIVMTHDYAHDAALLAFLLTTPARYIGVMGPARRTQRMLRTMDLAADSALDRLHAPAGLDIGADGPEEVALSIIAEMRAVLDERQGGMLRDRVGGIHGDRSDACITTESAR